MLLDAKMKRWITLLFSIAWVNLASGQGIVCVDPVTITVEEKGTAASSTNPFSVVTGELVTNETPCFGNFKLRGIAQSRLKQLADGSYLLDLSNSGITNLNIITNLPIKHLNIYSNAITDLSPLAGMSLTSICFDLRNIRRGIEVLLNMSSLELIVYDNIFGYGNIYCKKDTFATDMAGFIFMQELNSLGFHGDEHLFHLVADGDTLRSIAFQNLGDSNKYEHVRNGRGEKYSNDPKVGEIVVMRMIPENELSDLSSYEQILSSNLFTNAPRFRPSNEK